MKRVKLNRGKKKSQKKTYVAIVLDKSGSMSAVKKETIQGFNEQADTIINNADKGGDTFVSLITFNDVPELLFDKSPVNVLEHLNDTSYEPNGSTAMRDAVWDAIQNLEQTEVTDETAYLVIVISDGQENASRRTPSQNLADKITALQATGRWTFAYMGANQDLSEVAQEYNIPMNNVMVYNSTPTGTSKGLMANADALGSYFTSTRAVGSTSNTSFYSPDNASITAAASPSTTYTVHATPSDFSFKVTNPTNIKPPKKEKKRIKH